MLMSALLAAVLSAPAAASSNDCLFDADCGSRPGLTIESPAPEVPAEDSAAAVKTLSRLGGTKKGAEEGALFGFMGTIAPAAGLLSEGYGRKMSGYYDGARADNGNADAYYYGGIALAVVLYIPALVVGGLGGLVGGLVGAASPETVKDWDAEKTLFDSRPKK